ncbi:MAG: hypothetical protein ABEJ05_14385 [Haloglomus sp.]
MDEDGNEDGDEDGNEDGDEDEHPVCGPDCPAAEPVDRAATEPRGGVSRE